MESFDVPFSVGDDDASEVELKVVAWDDFAVEKSWTASLQNTPCAPFTAIVNSGELGVACEGAEAESSAMDVEEGSGDYGEVVASTPSASVPLPSWSVTPGPALSDQESKSNPLLLGQFARGYDEGYKLATTSTTSSGGPDLEDPTSKRLKPT